MRVKLTNLMLDALIGCIRAWCVMTGGHLFGEWKHHYLSERRFSYQFCEHCAAHHFHHDSDVY